MIPIPISLKKYLIVIISIRICTAFPLHYSFSVTEVKEGVSLERHQHGVDDMYEKTDT